MVGMGGRISGVLFVGEETWDLEVDERERLESESGKETVNS